MKLINKFLNNTTMYRLTIYYLIAVYLTSIVLSLFNLLSFSPITLIYSGVFIAIICWITNEIFAYVFNAPSNGESTIITSLILLLIISPAENFVDKNFYEIAFWSSVIAISSKYIISIKDKHIFNPAALGVVVTYLWLGEGANWWVGNKLLLPVVLVGGVLLIKKISRYEVVFSYLFVAVLGVIISKWGNVSVVEQVEKIILNTPLLFLGFVMLTEPLTSPSTHKMRVMYGFLVGVFFIPNFNILNYYFTPEIGLLAGNIFSYLVSNKTKLILKLQEVIPLSKDTFDFVFASERALYFKPGQYLEWTLPHFRPDDRGIRRYFTLSSSPTEDSIKVGVKIPENSSTFKKSLAKMQPGDFMYANHLSGDFTIPKNSRKKLVFMAGGIGITPFRSMIRYLLDRNEKRDIVIIYSAKSINDFAYKDELDKASDLVGIKMLYCLTDSQNAPKNWDGLVGRVEQKDIVENIPDFYQRFFYLSGPTAMVNSNTTILKRLGIPKRKIKTDYFPGF